MGRLGRIHLGRPLAVKSRRELLSTIRPGQRRFLRADPVDLPPMEDAATSDTAVPQPA
ncbi:MAG: hypothetical protein R2752_17650 [Vicinamibacterales bacterium]